MISQTQQCISSTEVHRAFSFEVACHVEEDSFRHTLGSTSGEVSKTDNFYLNCANSPSRPSPSRSKKRLDAAIHTVARLLAGGEIWAMPLFKRLEIERAGIDDEEDVVRRAILIAAEA